MYCRAKPSREENHKPKKCHRNTPSFSSTLLDEIYRSIDGGGNAEKAGAEINPGSHREKPATGLRSNNGGRRSSTGNHHEQTAAARFSRGCLARNNDKDLSFDSTAKSEVSNQNEAADFTREEANEFINSLFTNLNSNNKKTKKQDPKQQSSKVTSSSTPSSSTTSPSSRLSKHSSSIMRNNEIGINQPTVRFHPVGRPVSEDQDSPCRPKSIVYDNDRKLYGRPPLPPNALARNRNINQRRSDFSMFEEIDDEDGVSDSSSDLFELDHLVLFGNTNIFCQELPVYETTYFDNNRAVAAGLFCN
ncbi:PREDICTED: GATA zinc finger domain-containing protein 7-like [Erythranthe guttata]|uniref:GATA zinc finger domain-containing protein 7-like n=1 Tax=Erythranthe guttata TaxID=4155 RepID=UPI00064D9BD3|nr:PREDICTED: GATA zinc finger domain-containing protein 7-like [Erythranthe guttata]|eukprot:XP_012847049.1 PREDICTED: GATA zinc finger domain-containing protein 7-like [Erythranthe guttata]